MEDDQIRIATAAEGYDREDPQGIPVFGFAAIIVITLIASFVFVTYYYGTVTDNQIQAAVGNAVGSRDLGEVRAAEEDVLSRYKFTDKAKGKVNLPLDRAMALLEQEAKAGQLFYSTKSTPVKTAADLAAGAPGAVAGAVAGAATTATGAAAPVVTPAAGEHGKK